MTFKKLNKRRKIYFITFIILGSVSMSLGILVRDIPTFCLGFMSIIECCSIFNDQIADNIIDNYVDMIESTRKLHVYNYRIISKAIKENNPTRLKYIVEALDSYYGKGEENDSDEG